MSIELKEITNLKIVPENYESATVFEIKEINDDIIKIHLPIASDEELCDYKKGEKIEAFGLSKAGLVYFQSEISQSNNREVVIKYPAVLKEIQRRKYTRVRFLGNLELLEDKNVKIIPEDLSAGGLKFESDTPFDTGKEYKIKIELINNLVVECTIEPIRITENDETSENKYTISAKFSKIRSIDRIALMQYSLRLIAEMENKS